MVIPGTLARFYGVKPLSWLLPITINDTIHWSVQLLKKFFFRLFTTKNNLLS